MAHPLAPEWLTRPSDANELQRDLWSHGVDRIDGELTVASVRATELADRFGTPLYVLDEADAQSRARATREAFETAFAGVGADVKIYYAGKAFLSIEVARWMIAAGLNIDVCSGGELAVALAAGVAPHRLGFHGNNKSRAEIERAVEAGVGAIVIDSVQELERVADAARLHRMVQAVRVRVNNGVHAQTHEFLATAHEDQKFGIALNDVPAVVARIRELESLVFLGLHCHIGSQIFGSEGFAESATRLLALHAELLRSGAVPELNLGGGFGVAYTTADDPTPIEILAADIATTVAAECAKLDIPIPLVAFEPGRSIIAPSTFTLYTVGTTKRVVVQTGTGDQDATAVRTYVSVDGGMSDNARPALYGADYSVRIANRASNEPPILVRVAGKHCESGDIVVYADYLPGDIRPGDLVAVPVTGAYCWSLSNNYNFLGRPPVIAVRDGIARVIVRGETEADLLARDAAFDEGAVS